MERQKLEAEEEKARLREEKKGLERQMRDLHDTVSCGFVDHVVDHTILLYFPVSRSMHVFMFNNYRCFCSNHTPEQKTRNIKHDTQII